MTPEQFTAIRIGAGMSLEQLAAMLRVHPRTVRRYEMGETTISGPVTILMGFVQKGIDI